MFDTPETEPNAEELETDVELEEPTPEDESLEEDSGDTETDEEGQETDDDDGEEFLTLDGEDITLEEIREMKKGNLRQEDYTRKTQALADGKKQSLELNDRLTTTITALESMIDEEEIDLLILNTKEAGQLAMNGIAYAMAVEFKERPLLLL